MGCIANMGAVSSKNWKSKLEKLLPAFARAHCFRRAFSVLICNNMYYFLYTEMQVSFSVLEYLVIRTLRIRYSEQFIFFLYSFYNLKIQGLMVCFIWPFPILQSYNSLLPDGSVLVPRVRLVVLK